MLVKTSQMGTSRFISIETQFLELWNGYPKGIVDAPETGVKGAPLLFLRSRELLEKVASVGIVATIRTSVTLGITNKLRHDVQVSYLCERLNNVSK